MEFSKTNSGPIDDPVGSSDSVAKEHNKKHKKQEEKSNVIQKAHDQRKQTKVKKEKIEKREKEKQITEQKKKKIAEHASEDENNKNITETSEANEEEKQDKEVIQCKRPHLCLREHEEEYIQHHINHQCFKKKLLTDEEMSKFLSSGYIMLETQLPSSFHQACYEEGEELFLKSTMENPNPGNNILPEMPCLEHVFDDPVVHGALVSILGPKYSMHPHRFVHRTSSGSKDQIWHKDSYFGYQHLRHHRPHVVFGLYYPQETLKKMGPTIFLPETHCTDTRLGEAQSGENESFLNPQMDEIPSDWNVQPKPCETSEGSVVLIHYDLWHRGASNQSDKTRYLYKFVFCSK